MNLGSMFCICPPGEITAHYLTNNLSNNLDLWPPYYKKIQPSPISRDMRDPGIIEVPIFQLHYRMNVQGKHSTFSSFKQP